MKAGNTTREGVGLKPKNQLRIGERMYEKEKSTLLEQVWLLIRAGRLREVSGHGALGAGTPLFMPSCGRAVLLCLISLSVPCMHAPFSMHWSRSPLIKWQLHCPPLHTPLKTHLSCYSLMLIPTYLLNFKCRERHCLLCLPGSFRVSELNNKDEQMKKLRKGLATWMLWRIPWGKRNKLNITYLNGHTPTNIKEYWRLI